MVYRVNLRDDPAQREAKRTAALESQSPVGSTSITKPDGRLRVASLNGILAQSIPGGGPAISVEGRQSVTGTLDGTGTFTWTGPVNIGGTCTISGPLNVTGNVTTSGSFTNSGTFTNNGPTNLNGATKIAGTAEITGATTLKNSLTIGVGGKLVAGLVTIGETGVISSTGTLTLGGTSGTNVTSTLTAQAGATVASSFKVTSMPTTTNAANVFQDGTTGQFYRVGSAARFKIDAQLLDVDPGVLDGVRVKDWLDAGEVRRGVAERRIPGVIAEEVEAAGGETFCTYDDEGTITGVAYDRLAVARTQVLADRLQAALERIEDLEARLSS